MRLIAISNQKGGVGKTTCAVNLAASLGERGRRVCVLDIDPQANSTLWLGAEPDPGLALIFQEPGGHSLEPQPVVAVPPPELGPESAWRPPFLNVWVIPSSGIALASAEKQLAGEIGADGLLRPELQGLSDFDYVLIDCPPALGTLTINALVAAPEVIVPVEASILALAGLGQFTQTVEAVRSRLNADLAITGILLSKVDRRTVVAREIEEALRAQFGELVYQVTIRQSIRHVEAPAHRQPITLYDPNGQGAEDFHALALEVDNG